jgi:hypothetical protein
MTRYFAGAVALAVLMPMAALAASQWGGTWKLDVSTAHTPKKSDVFLLQGGTYEYKTCVPVEKVRSDGVDRAISGNSSIDSVTIKIVSDRTTQEADKKDGITVATSTIAIASDGKTGLVEFADSSNRNAEPVTGNAKITRVADGPKACA